MGEGDVDKERAEIRDVRLSVPSWAVSACSHAQNVYGSWKLLLIHMWTSQRSVVLCLKCVVPAALQRNPFSKEQEGGTQIGGGGEGSAS